MSVGPLYGQTPNYSFDLINYDFPRWQSYEHTNWSTLDTTLAVLFGEFGFKGVWQNGIVYNVNERLLDGNNNTAYLCLVNHQSADVGTFEQDRDANPSYWRSLSYNPTNRGNWAAATQYNTQDIVTNGSQIAICQLAHLSSNSFSNDVTAGYWSVIIDVSGFNIGLALVKNNNLSDLQNVATARSNLGLNSAALLTAGAVFNVSNNLSEGVPSLMRASLGLGTAATTNASSYMLAANNLSELTNKGTARNNLGLAALATQSSITSTQISDAGVVGLNLLTSATPLQAVGYLPPFVGDTGSGGSKGLAPAPGAGDAASGKFLSAGGNWVVPNYPLIPTPPPASYINNVVITCTSNTAISVSYGGGAITNAAKNASQTFGAGSFGINLSNVGPGGIQNGMSVLTGWYSVYIIGNGSTVSGLLSDTSATPVLPSGYTFYKRLGWVRASATSSLLITRQTGNRVVLAQAPILLVSGTQGTHGGGYTGTYNYVAINVSAYIPPTGSAVEGYMQSGRIATTYLSTYSGATNNRGLSPPNIALENLAIGVIENYYFNFIPVDGANLYAYSDSNNFAIYITGWEDGA